MNILHEICKGHSKWVRMAQKFDYDNAEDLEIGRASCRERV